MTPHRSSRRAAAALAGIALLAGCAAPGAQAAPDRPLSIAIGEPVSPLVPGSTVEENGTQVVEALWTGLVQYDADGAVEYTGVAEEVVSDDDTEWTITLEDDWTFHDGSPVTATSFVDAWNWTAHSPNAQAASYFLAGIEGYDDLQAPLDEAGEPTGEPVAAEMSGLRVVDDRTFTVTLGAPFAQFPLMLGYNPFLPLPGSFYDDPEGFGAQPVGNGPFRADGALVPGEGITVRAYDEYAGARPASVDALEFRVYADPRTAYTDALAGNLDVVPRIPAESVAGAEGDFGDGVVTTTLAGFTFLGLPLYEERYADVRVRRALSLAVDRGLIATEIFAGSRTPADALVPPVVDGHRDGACAYCVLDVDRANQLLDDAGFDRDEPVQLWFNAGGGNESWMEAVANQLRTHLGVEVELRGDLAPPEYGPLLGSQGMTGPFRMGWAMDYPSPQNFLAPLYGSAGGANFVGYDNPAVDRLIATGDAAGSSEEAIAAYNRAEDLVLEDMPVLPMFFDVAWSVHSGAVDGLTVDVFGRVDTTALTRGA